MDILRRNSYDFPVQSWNARHLRTRSVAIAMSAVLAVLVLAGLCSCSQPAPQDPALAIDLRWVQNYHGEKKGNVNTGLYWALSFLGAKLPASANILTWHGSVVTLDLGAAQVQPGSQAAWKKLLQTLKSSDEYRRMGAIDIGRFVFLSLCSANHYYALTSSSPTFAQFLARHSFGARQIAVVESGVAHGNRLIEVGTGGAGNTGDTVDTIAFVAYEGSGALKDGSFHKADVETLEFMPNGQLHFGLYDLAGNLRTATTPSLTRAGKPSKCLWCHEINLQPPFFNKTDVPGYYSTQQFKDLIAGQMRMVAGYRQTLRSKVDFRKTQDHTNAENLYISFAQPTAERLAAEWRLPIAAVRGILQAGKLKTHPHSTEADDGILGDQLYDRTEVDALAPYRGVRGPTDFREASSYEPDLLR
jgi:hypothetical protein